MSLDNASKGNHYVPQYYLKGFSLDDNILWVFEKSTGRKFETQIKNVGKITNFYSPNVEQYLANTIEGPANAVITKIRNMERIDNEDKRILAEYMDVLWKRVPKAKERMRKMVPSVAYKLAQEYDRKLDIIASQEPSKTSFVEKRRREIKDILEKYAEDPPTEIWLDNIPPERSPRVVAAIKSMKWIFLVTDTSSTFITSDNPVFHFSSIGVGKPESEITFPISSLICLWATWRDDQSQEYIKTTKQAVKEINRRTVSNATRYIFHSRDEYWIEPFVKKCNWQLHLMK